MPNYIDRLKASISVRRSILCVGLDPELARLPENFTPSISGIVAFNQAIIAATSDLVCAYKPNLAFYEALGRDGFGALQDTMAAIPADIPVIGDAKRGDIGNTARASATAMFDQFRFDAVTVNPYLGEDSLMPFFERADRGVYVVCRTSNPGGSELQNLMVGYEGRSRPFYEVVALKTRLWNRLGNAAIVVGATAPGELQSIRELTPELPILIPAIGAQGGDIAAAARAHRPDAPAVVNASRSILYASTGIDFADAARCSAIHLRDQLREFGRL